MGSRSLGTERCGTGTLTPLPASILSSIEVFHLSQPCPDKKPVILSI